MKCSHMTAGLTPLLEQHLGSLQELNVVHRHVRERRHVPPLPVLLERVARLGAVMEVRQEDVGAVVALCDEVGDRVSPLRQGMSCQPLPVP